MASAEHEPITGVWGHSPQRGPGAEPLVRRSGGRSPPEAESILVIGCPTEPANLALPKMHLYFYSRCNGNDMGKIYVEIQVGSGDPPCPFLGASMATSLQPKAERYQHHIHSCCDSPANQITSFIPYSGWLGSRVGSVLDSGAEGPGFKSQSRRCWVTV